MANYVIGGIVLLALFLVTVLRDAQADDRSRRAATSKRAAKND